MGFWKKLKKLKVGSIVKKALKFVPGGNYIEQGVGVLEGVVKQVTAKKPTVTPSVTTIDPTTTATLQQQKSNTMLYVLIGVGALFILPKIMKG